MEGHELSRQDFVWDGGTIWGAAKAELTWDSASKAEFMPHCPAKADGSVAALA